MFEKLKNLFKKPEAPKPEAKTKPKAEKKLSPKELATQNGEPYIAIIKVEVDPENINNGSFELDWNDKFLLNLVKTGYKKSESDTDNDIVDRWFQTVCRNIALEVYEQEIADPEKRRNENLRVVQQRDIGNGRTEIS